MSKICPFCHKLIYASNISTVVGIDSYCSCAANVNYKSIKHKTMIKEPSMYFVNVDQDGQYFTDLAQIYNCLTIKEEGDEYKKLAIKALDNTIKKGYKLVDKDNQYFDWPVFKKTPRVIPYQLCPKCNGVGIVVSNNFMTQQELTLSNPIFPTCDVCNGAKIIPQYEVK